MHPWVYEREIKGISTSVQQYVNEHIKVYDYNEFIPDEDDVYIYASHFGILFKEMNGTALPVDPLTFKSYIHSGQNLGEIHSVILSVFTGIPVLLSDDYNAKKITAKRINNDGYTLDVKKSLEVLCDIISKDKTIITKDDAISIVRELKEHRHGDRKKRKKMIKDLYK